LIVNLHLAKYLADRIRPSDRSFGHPWVTTTNDYDITHSIHVQDDVLYNTRRCNNFKFTIQWWL